MTSHPLWNLSLSSRLGLLRAGTIRIAFLYPKPDVGTFRYRCFNPVQAINGGSPSHSASYFFLSDLKAIEDLSEFADVLVVVRTPYDAPLDRLYRKFRHRGKKIYFDIDDLVFTPDFAALVAANLGYQLEGEHLNQWTAFMTNIGKALRNADAVTTTHKFLAERIADVTNSPVHIFPNSLNAEQLEVSRAIASDQGRQGALRIAYFSGSPSHSLDFEVARQGITSFLRKSPDSTLSVVGHLEIPQELRSLGNRVTSLPFMDFLEMQKVMGNYDVSIVPLQNSMFTHSKSELKYFEAAAASTITLASHSPLFSKVISPGVTGMLAKPDCWASSLHFLETMTIADRESMATAARKHAVETYSPKALLPHLNAIFAREN